ncbi:MAG: HEAT repeat domain-containing protein, partial [Chloroflexales bacterium]
MLTPHSFPFFRGGRTIRLVRSALQRHIQDEPAARLLPALLQIPIAPAPIPDPAAILAHAGGIALCGPPASGRSLAMLQIQARWAATGAGGPTIALALAADDASNLSPRAIVAGAIHRAGLPASYAEGDRPMILLLDGWEELSADRRALWRSYAVAAATWPVARVVISLPADEAWFGMASLDLVAPDDDALAVWLGQLLPAHDPGIILAALACEPLAAMRGNVGDLLLLALIYPIIGMPLSRAHLYEQAYALARPILGDAEDGAGQGVGLLV